MIPEAIAAEADDPEITEHVESRPVVCWNSQFKRSDIFQLTIIESPPETAAITAEHPSA